MADVMVFDRKEAERQALIRLLRDAVAFYSDDKAEVEECFSERSAYSFILKKTLDMAMLEVSDEKDVDLCADFRRKQFAAELLLIADQKLSPMEYLKPSIRAASLLLRPFSRDKAAAVLNEFISGYYRGRLIEGADTVVIENRYGKTVIPTLKICYLEVRDKRVYVRMEDREYIQYDSLDNMLKKLPSYFIRCHRSYAFNRTYLQRVRLSENLIMLEHGITIPLSRSYKTQIKELLHEYRTD